MLAWRIYHLLFLQIIGKDERGDAVVSLGDPNRAIDQVAHLRRNHGIAGERARHVLEHRRHVEFLLIMRPHRRARLLPDDGQHRHMVEPRIVQACQKMRGARPRGRETNTELARKFRMSRSHESRHFLVPYLDELELVLHLVERADKAVDSIARVAEDAAHAPLVKAFPDKMRYRLCHSFS
jgi:hypothetical protein